MAYREADLVKQAMPAVERRLAERGRVVGLRREMPVMWRQADLVGLVDAGLTGPVPPRPFSYAEADGLRLLRQVGRCSQDRLIAWGLKPRSLRQFEAYGLIRRDDEGQFRLAAKLFHGLHVTAVEAKLHRWREAIEQAVVYRAYADQAYVLMPEENAKPAIANKREFKKACVGLWTFGDDGLTEVIPAAVQTRGHDFRERPFVISRLWQLGAQSASEASYSSKASSQPAAGAISP